MRRYSALAWLILALSSGAVQANSRYHQNEQSSSPDVVVDMPPEVWAQGQNRQPDCIRCCIFNNRNYSEGAVVKSEGVLLQCARDEQSLGTNNLIWKIVK
ncbi:DUF1496 domain-containing protein [Pantoea sp. LMR881]|uniref:DUF1496 domain-containing protein n=1 Tax=Pantoea sp. LMR881 TaxID=3014336 RepID=UPI0022B07471|nr:DUF1496 domain-containing protein [Pantoea sp. LMR881]MCZ4058311.1 DUF1496 domain-containing protein [Pantoea sp. LMR881]